MNLGYIWVSIENNDIFNNIPIYITSTTYNIGVSIFEYTLPLFLSKREVELSFSVIPTAIRLANIPIPLVNYYWKYHFLKVP